MPEKPKSSASSTISRLESKYSDVLGRRRRKEQEDEDDDRDKTLEPEKSYGNALSKSATSAYLGSTGGASSAIGMKKERTPFRLHRNHSDRAAANKYRSRPELSLLQGSSAAGSSRAAAYDWDTSSRVPARYNDYDGGGARQRTANNYGAGHYEGRDRDKENSYKSKYEPSLLYADVNNNDAYGGRDRERRRFMKYKRTGTTAIGGDRRYTTNFRDYDHDLLYGPTSSSIAGASGAAASGGSSAAGRFAPRKTHAYQRSKTQIFLDSETTNAGSSTRTPMDANNNSLLDVGGALLDDDEPKTEQQREREARRKEIQGLIMKYAQIDDIYNRATEHEAANKSTQNKSSNAGKQTNDLLSVNSAHQRSLLPLSKTQSVSVMPSSTTSSIRSRIPKTLSTFVRHTHNILFHRLVLLDMLLCFSMLMRDSIVMVESLPLCSHCFCL